MGCLCGKCIPSGGRERKGTGASSYGYKLVERSVTSNDINQTLSTSDTDVDSDNTVFPTHEQQLILLQTWDACVHEEMKNIAMNMHLGIFQLLPDLEHLTQSDGSQEYNKLFATLGERFVVVVDDIVRKINDKAEVDRLLYQLSKRHYGYKALPQAIQLFKNQILYELRPTLSADVNHPARIAWYVLFSYISNSMVGHYPSFQNAPQDGANSADSRIPMRSNGHDNRHNDGQNNRQEEMDDTTQPLCSVPLNCDRTLSNKKDSLDTRLPRRSGRRNSADIIPSFGIPGKQPRKLSLPFAVIPSYLLDHSSIDSNSKLSSLESITARAESLVFGRDSREAIM